MTYRLLLLSMLLGISSAFGLIYSCSTPEKESSSEMPVQMKPGFVGDQQCASCHADQFKDWQGSHHDYAMKKATDKFVRGDFDNTTFTHHGESYRFFRRDDHFWVEYHSASGKKIYQVRYTFGWEPLQQYLIEFGKGKLQALNIAWDTKQKKWFALNPEEDFRHGDWLHWTGGAMNWNTMCASCHSTNLQKNYIASADSFHTTWSSINVSCEACHGPGQKHAEFMQSQEASDATIARIRQDLKLTETTGQIAQIEQCAQCHSLREQTTENYFHSGDFLDHFNPTLPHPDMYFADGQIKDEVYVYGSFLQSKMFKEGVECVDCHDPHTLKLKANVGDNSLCMSCHEPRYNTQKHYFHEPNTEVSQCISCHMTGHFYMQNDFRRDHSFRVPRPDLSVKFGTPNACNNCHDNRSAKWTAKAVEQWYGPDRPNHFSEVLAKADSLGSEAIPELKQLIADTAQPGIARATAVWYLGQFQTQQSISLLEQTLKDESSLVRKSTAQALASLPPELKRTALQDALDDSIQTVRVLAAGGLAEFSASDMVPSLKSYFNLAMEEYRQYLEANQYFPQGQMNLGQYYEKQGQVEQAIKAYETALQKDSLFNPARINLAYIYNRKGENRQAEKLLETVIQQEPENGVAYYSLALLQSEENRLTDALPNFERAAELMPENHRLKYNWAIALQTQKKMNEAKEVYLQAIKLAPQNPDYRYGICTLYLQQNEAKRALPHAQKLIELLPNNPQAKQLLRSIKQSK